MNTKNAGSYAGVVLLLTEDKKESPFIYRGNLNDSDLLAWLRKLLNVLETKDSSTEHVKELYLSLERAKINQARVSEFISANVYPRDPDPIQSLDSPDVDKQTVLKGNH